MATYTNTPTVSGLLPADYGELIIRPVQTGSVALQPTVSTTITTPAHVFHVPIVDTDAAASWVLEGAEIALTDPTISEIVVTPAKLAALTVISSELAADSSPAAQQIVGDGLARALAAQLDLAYFGALAAPAPPGLGSLSEDVDPHVSLVYAGATPTNLDAFAEAMSLVEQDGGAITAFVANPSDALMVQTLKTGTDRNTPLLGTDATNGTARQVLGVPLLVSPKITQGVIWGCSAARCLAVMREDVSVEVDASVFFTSDRIAVRGIMRVGFAFPSPPSVAKIKLAVAP